jgi:hypothetical protein
LCVEDTFYCDVQLRLLPKTEEITEEITEEMISEFRQRVLKRVPKGKVLLATERIRNKVIIWMRFSCWLFRL